ncbi:dolichyl-phosphate mannosyltransferase 2 regulatory subunit, partial [Piromyces finnis]
VSIALIDKIVGSVFIAIGSIVCGYYTLWAIILPFFPQDSKIQSYFLPRKYAVILPLLTLILGVSAIFGYLYISGQQQAKKKEKST